MSTQLPIQVRSSRLLGALRERLAGVRHRFLAQRRAVQRPKRPLFSQRQGHHAGRRPAVCEPACRACRSINKSPIPGVTQPGTLQWLNPDAFVSMLIPAPAPATGETARQNCQFGNLGRNSLRGPDFTWSDLYLTKRFSFNERVTLRLEGQFFNFLNHPNFALPTSVAGIPGEAGTQTGFGALRRDDLAAHRLAGRRPGRR